jgi:potassium-transporting ATPase KdpC subunit
MKQTLAGLRMLLVLTVITGILYPLGVWVVSRVPGLESHAEGSMVTVDGRTVGSDLIGIDPVATDPAHDPYFHNRPSGVSNKGAFDDTLVATIKQRQETIAKREGVDPSQVPADAVTASASGLDPDISPAYAELQVPRVARENGLSEQRVRTLVEASTTGRGLGFLGEPAVNVLTLNLAVRAAASGAH